MNVLSASVGLIREARTIVRLWTILRPALDVARKANVLPATRLIHAAAALDPYVEEVEVLWSRLDRAITGDEQPFTVSRYQLFLRERGLYSGEVDDDPGELTKAAVKAYQREHGLHVDGYVGVETMNDMLNRGA